MFIILLSYPPLALSPLLSPPLPFALRSLLTSPLPITHSSPPLCPSLTPPLPFALHSLLPSPPTVCSCQFVVRTGTDYSLHLSDPDTLVDWEQVEQVVRMYDTVCGHV